MNTQQEIKELIEKINESLNKLNELEANYKREKPVIEVGKVYKENGWMLFIKSKHDNFEKEGWCDVFGFHRNGNFINDQRVVEGEDWTEATKEEWETALTKYFDKYYEGVGKVDISNLEINNKDTLLVEFDNEYEPDLRTNGTFFYKDVPVMDKHGNIAKPVKDEVKEMYVNVFNNGHKNYVGMNIHDSIDNCHESIGLSYDTKHLGIFKLVKVNETIE